MSGKKVYIGVVSKLKDNVLWINNDPFEQSIHREQLNKMLKDMEIRHAAWFHDSFFIITPDSSYIQQTIPSIDRGCRKRLIMVSFGPEDGRLVYRPKPDENEFLFQNYLGSNTPPPYNMNTFFRCRW